jgi:ribA/ribD-fused uncharacterized protein
MSCPRGKIMNPETGRCVDINGKIGKQLIKKVISTNKQTYNTHTIKVPVKTTTTSATMSIEFYEKTAPYYEFSNFYMSPKMNIQIDGKSWISTEQYFQAAKFYMPESERHMEYFNIIQSTDSPMKCMYVARQKKKGGYAGKWVVNKLTDKRTLNDVIEKYQDLAIRADWDDVRNDVMYLALTAKFTQNENLKKLLKDTGDAEIIEASPRDDYWGWGKNKDGQNMLGKLLMKCRRRAAAP